MKKLLVVAVALASVNAFASRARVVALGNASNLVDTQTILSNPADIMMMGDFVNFEAGATNTEVEAVDCDPSTPGNQPCNTNLQYGNAEGTITRSMGESKLGLTLGYQSKNAAVWGLRNLKYSGVTGIKSQQNPVNLTYGFKLNDMLLGGTLVYSNYNDKAANIKESSAGLRFGMRMGVMDAKLGIGIDNKFSNAAQNYKGTAGYSAGFGYMMDDVYLNAGAEIAGFTVEDATTGAEQRKLDYSKFNIGALQTHKSEGGQLFYGLGLSSETIKVNLSVPAVVESKTTTMAMPLVVGMEVDAATWMTLRGSITQTTVINSSKTELNGTTSTEVAPGKNSTVAALGAGFKFNKLTVDGTLQGLTGDSATQDLNGNKLLGTVGVTYMF